MKSNQIQHENLIPINLEGCSVLIVEDDVFSFEIMKFLLSETKADLFYAGNGEEAIEIIEDHRIDFVFLDLHLPVLNGFKVIHHIRQFNKEIPVIAQTSFVFQKDKEKIFNAGFNDFIIKPFSKEQIYNILNKFLKAEPHMG